MRLRLLSADDVIAALPMDDAVAAVRDAYVVAHRGTASMPTRLQVPTATGTSLFMPAYDPSIAATSVKVVSVYPDNPGRGLPSINGLVVLLDADTGVPVAALDGTVLTALRTGAASGVSTDVLARDDARVLAVVGAGAQAPWQVRAVAAVRSIAEVRIANRTRERAEALAEHLRAEMAEVRVTVTDAAEDAVAEADVICTATSSPDPVLDATAVAPGTHVSAVGSFRPDMRELPRQLLAAAGRVYVDERDAALAEAGEVIDARNAGIVDDGRILEIGGVVDGSLPGRSDADEITVFKSCGLALQDLHAAARVVETAAASGIGTLVDL